MIEVRALTAQQEFSDAVALQKVIWGFEDVELLPLRLFVVATKIGGQAFGAFDGGRMIAFCLAIPGLKSGGRFYLHSHMLGVLDEYRDQGVGRMLKLRQREDALARAIPLVEWTFDPLELKNAYFNIMRLGAVVGRYVLNQYGITGSHLHGALPTDRCVAEWWVGGERVKALLDSPTGRLPQCKPVASIRVPMIAAKLRTEDPKRAREIQKSVSDQFLEQFSKGLAVTGFEKTETEGIYLFEPWQ